MKKFYYPVWYRLDKKDRYLIWYRGDEPSRSEEDLDGVLLNFKGLIPIFVSLDTLSAYAQTEDIPLEVDNIPIQQNELNLHNFDSVVKWLKVKHSKPEGPTALNCDEFLAAWNLFADVSRSISGNFDADRDRTQKIYAKLFWGNNLPSLTPVGKSYIPLWSRNERKILREVMSQGLQMFRSNIERQ